MEPARDTMEPAQDKVVFIGLGPFGYNVLVKLKRALLTLGEEGGREEDVPWDRDVRFLAVGFDPRIELPPGEYLELEVVGQLPEGQAGALDPAVSADSARRGRPDYAAQAWLSAVSRESEMLGRLRNLTDGLGIGGGTTCRYYLICSLAEPQGAGLLLPVAGLVRRMAHNEGRSELLRQCAMLVVPPGLRREEKAQVAATLREVVQAETAGWPSPMTPGLQRDPGEGNQHVFSLGCYLVESAHEGDGTCAPETVAQMSLLVAEWLAYLALPRVLDGLRQAGLAVPRRDAVEVAGAEGSDEAPSEARTGPLFSSLGLADYVVPVSGLIDRCGRRLAMELVRTTLLDDPREGGIDQAEAFIGLAKLGAVPLETELAAMQPGRPMDRPLADDAALVWKKPGDIDEAWRRRESMEKQDLSANVHDLGLKVETRVAEVGRQLQAEALSLAGRNPLGAFDRVTAFLAETRARLLGLETGIGQDNARIQAGAEHLFSVLPGRRARALWCEARIRGLWLACKLLGGLGIALEAVSAVFLWVLRTTIPDTILGIRATGRSCLLAAAISALLALWCAWMAKKHVAQVREYLALVRRHHLLEAVGRVLGGAKSKALDVGRFIKDLKADVEDLPTRLGRLAPQILNSPSSAGAVAFLGFPGRDSLVTQVMERELYEKGSGGAQLGEGAALRALALEVFAPPDGLSNWLSLSSAERDEELLAFCRKRFHDYGLPDAETLLVDRLLEGGRRSKSEADTLVSRELAAHLLRRMQPRSSHGLTATRTSQVIGLSEPVRSRLRKGIDELNLQRGQLYEIGTGLPFRVVGFSFRHDLSLDSLRAYADWQGAYAEVEDSNLFHTRLVFSGRAVPSAGPQSSWAERTRAEKQGGQETEEDGGDRAWAEPVVPGSGESPTGSAGEPETPDADSSWTGDWSTVPEVEVPFPPPEAESGSPAGDTAADAAAYRLFGLEPGAAPEKVEEAYWTAHGRYNSDTGTQKNVNRMAEFNAAYDRIKTGWRAAA